MSKHKCKALVISCIDFRFVSKVRDFLTSHELKEDYDLVTVPGASLGIEKVTDSISTSLLLHEPENIYIFDHEDCGAYGEDNSLDTHMRNLKKAEQLLTQKYADKKVLTYIAGFDKIEEIP